MHHSIHVTSSQEIPCFCPCHVATLNIHGKLHLSDWLLDNLIVLCLSILTVSESLSQSELVL